MSWQNRIIGYETKPASAFKPNPLNWRTHPNVQREALRGLLGEVGWVGAVLENKRTGNLIDGHARIEEALSKDENAPIPYLLVDLSEEEERLVLASFDPISALANSDKERLELLLKDLSSSSEAVDSLLRDVAKKNGVVLEQKDVPDAQIDRAAELQEKWKVKRGDLYEIASQTAPNKTHRLLCGDATEKADVRAVCGDNKPLLMVTDPPYGVKYDAQWRQDAADKGHLAKARRAVGKVTNDDRAEWLPAFEICPADVCYVWHASASASAVRFAVDLMSAGFEIRNQIIWSKPAFAISRGHYNWQHEPCWYAVRKGKRSGWIGDHSESTIWEISNRNAEHTDHSTEKPLECMARPIRNHSGDVYDPFVGSGTTICAAEINKRACYAIEIKPEYVAVTLERLQLMGLQPKLVQEAHGKAA